MVMCKAVAKVRAWPSGQSAAPTFLVVEDCTVCQHGSAAILNAEKSAISL